MAGEEYVWHGEGWYRVQDLRRLPAWVSVSVRLPEHGDTVWVFDGKDVFLGEYWGTFESYGASCDTEGLHSETLAGITHWMDLAEPLPPPAK